jgi:putative toxin-antitoxin system antitoxin component (TIGR02293 family)
MSPSAEHGGSELSPTTTYPQQAADMLGIKKNFKDSTPDSGVAVHDVLAKGLPRRALLRAVRAIDFPMDQVLSILGLSLRTFMRIKEAPEKRLDPEQSGRLWRFIELLAKAKDVFGADDRVMEWMFSPAMALENRRPVDLLTTPVGMQLVDDVLDRIKFGVYQ